MVMGGDSCFIGRRFGSRHRILDVYFFLCICCKTCNDVCLKRPKIKYQRGRGGPIFYKKNQLKVKWLSMPISCPVWPRYLTNPSPLI